jgi:hypothetical protein
MSVESVVGGCIHHDVTCKASRNGNVVLPFRPQHAIMVAGYSTWSQYGQQCA